MLFNILLEKHLTMGKLRELVNDKLLALPDESIIDMNIDVTDATISAPINNIIVDNNRIEFYNK